MKRMAILGALAFALVGFAWTDPLPPTEPTDADRCVSSAGAPAEATEQVARASGDEQAQGLGGGAIRVATAHGRRETQLAPDTTLDGATPNGPITPDGDAAIDGASQRHTVTFRCSEEGPSNASEQATRVLAQNAANAEVESIAWSSDATEAPLADGEYFAALSDDDGSVGPVASFAVAGEPIEVTLQPLAALQLSFSVEEHGSRDLLPDVAVRVTRVDTDPLGPEFADTRDTRSDGAGIVRFENLPRGVWAFTLAADGYAETTGELELPGEWSPDVDDTGHLDLGEFRMKAIRPFVVQLQGHREWGGSAGFRIASSAEGEQFEFDLDGKTTIPLGWHSEPLFLKLWYPSGQLAVLYLDAGMPPRVIRSTSTSAEAALSKSTSASPTPPRPSWPPHSTH